MRSLAQQVLSNNIKPFTVSFGEATWKENASLLLDLHPITADPEVHRRIFTNYEFEIFAQYSVGKDGNFDQHPALYIKKRA